MFLTTVVWLIIVSLFRWSWQLNLVWLWLGGLLGALLPEADRFFRFRSPLFESLKLTFHSTLFQLVLYALGFFVLTSTGSFFGVGLVMGMLLHLLYDEIRTCLRQNLVSRGLEIENFKDFQKRFFVILMTLIFIGFHLLLIYRFTP